jgi:hypothetical protein
MDRMPLVAARRHRYLPRERPEARTVPDLASQCRIQSRPREIPPRFFSVAAALAALKVVVPGDYLGLGYGGNERVAPCGSKQLARMRRTGPAMRHNTAVLTLNVIWQAFLPLFGGHRNVEHI